MSNYQPAGVRVQGFNKAVRAVRDIGVPASEVKQAGKDSAQVVANEARMLVPVRTGRLRDSIRLSSTLRSVKITAGNNRTTRSGIPYANPIHWGWFRRNIKPQPFFVRALGLTRDQVYNNYYKQLNNLIRKQTAQKDTGI